MRACPGGARCRHFFFCVALISIAYALSSGGARAEARPVNLGEVTTARAQAAKRMKATFRRLVNHELTRVTRTLPHDGSPRYVLSASLLRLETLAHRGQVRTTCVVSATVREAKSGALFAILRGQGRVEDNAESDENRLLALDAAVRGALKRLPEALSR